MRRAHLAALALAAVAAAGCLPRLSDPFFAYRCLGAPEAEPGRSLVFGTIVLDPGLFSPGEVAEVVLKRIRPAQDEIQRVATVRLPFRAFRSRQVKDGHFILALEPGAYEIVRIVGDGWVAPELSVGEDGRRATRFTVTRPAVVDLGVIHVSPASLGSYAIELRAAPSDPARAAALGAAIAGTSWERFPKVEVQR